MEVNLTRKTGALFEAKNKEGQTILLDGPPSVGGTNKYFRPMELLLSSLAGCSAVDILLILQQGKQTINDFNIKINGERADTTPAVFKKINIHFVLSGDITENKLKRAIDLSMKKYCSVAKMLQESVEIFYTYELNKG